MSSELQTHGDLADFLKRLLRNQMKHAWEIDDFESVSIAPSKKNEKWGIEKWRLCILDIASAKEAPEGQWMHPDARSPIERIMEALQYIDENRNCNE